MLREVSGAPAVGFGGLAGHAEISDQGLASGQLPFVFGKAQRLAGGVQAQRIPAIGRLQLRVPPLGEPQLRGPSGALLQMKIPAEAVPLERGVEGVFDAIRGKHERPYIRRQLRAQLGQIRHLNRPSVQGVGKQQDLEVRVLRVFIKPRLGDRLRGIGFDVNGKMVHNVLLRKGTPCGVPDSRGDQTPMIGAPGLIGCPVMGSIAGAACG